MNLKRDASQIIRAALLAAQPDTAVRKALGSIPPAKGRRVLIGFGKAAWQMASAAVSAPGFAFSSGVVVTKYGHAPGPLAGIEIFEAGHPIPDENSFRGTEAAIRAVQGLKPEDQVLILISGGGSALFEKPLIDPDELANVTRQLLACGADIVEINTIRKRLSAVKGGRFAQLCAPAEVFVVVLSDIVGDPLDMIASGPACPDHTTCAQALEIVKKYRLKLSKAAMDCLQIDTPKSLMRTTTFITGSVTQLCEAAESTCRSLGYRPTTLTAQLSCEAREAGSFLAAIARHHASTSEPLAFIAGGETVVHLTGHGLGGRNQELALSAAKGLDGLENVLLFSIGSDGTDGPTDAAGGIVSGETASILRGKDVSIDRALADNDAYHALAQCDGLIITGPTGTNVNDLAVLLIAGRPSA